MTETRQHRSFVGAVASPILCGVAPQLGSWGPCSSRRVAVAASVGCLGARSGGARARGPTSAALAAGWGGSWVGAAHRSLVSTPTPPPLRFSAALPEERGVGAVLGGQCEAPTVTERDWGATPREAATHACLSGGTDMALRRACWGRLCSFVSASPTSTADFCPWDIGRHVPCKSDVEGAMDEEEGAGEEGVGFGGQWSSCWPRPPSSTTFAEQIDLGTDGQPI